jgi:dTDP-4-dehydrorhamnose reductase
MLSSNLSSGITFNKVDQITSIMKIILFGATGMLGKYVMSVLSETFVVAPVIRDVFDIETSNWIELDRILNAIIDQNDPIPTIIINCAGAIPQKKSKIRQYISLNVLFPHKLADYVIEHNLRMIHITTDCVFSGDRGHYDENSVHDADDIYGISKSLGEPETICNIRTSIIGEDPRSKTSLLEWVIDHNKGDLDGYVNSLWNGVTCLQLAKTIDYMLKNDIYWVGVRHVHSPIIVSKYDLCIMIAEIYGLDIVIRRMENAKQNKSLSTLWPLFNIPPIHEQIQEQRLWYILKSTCR